MARTAVPFRASATLLDSAFGAFALSLLDVAIGAKHGTKAHRESDVEEGERHPTDPSSEMPISFCVSAMNSIGSCCNTSRTKPLTISATASSCERPRDMQ